MSSDVKEDILAESCKGHFGYPCPLLRVTGDSERYCLMDRELTEITTVNIIELDLQFIKTLMKGKHQSFCLNLLLNKSGICFCPTKLINIEFFGELLEFRDFQDYIILGRKVGILSEHSQDCSQCLHKMIYLEKSE
ncbi:MAG: hypothetical protein ACXAEU_19055 [Candidatus Hodarchaeales archaeon]